MAVKPYITRVYEWLYDDSKWNWCYAYF